MLIRFLNNVYLYLLSLLKMTRKYLRNIKKMYIKAIYVVTQ